MLLAGQRSVEADETLAADLLAPPGFASREHNEIRLQIEFGDLAGVQDAV